MKQLLNVTLKEDFKSIFKHTLSHIYDFSLSNVLLPAGKRFFDYISVFEL